MRKLLALLFALWAAPLCAQQSLGPTTLQTRPSGSGGPTVDDVVTYAITKQGSAYVPGRFYLPYGTFAGYTAGVAPGANSIKFFPGYIYSPVTINTLFIRCNVSGGNAQAAIYAAGSNGYPTGNPLTLSGSVAISSTTGFSVPITTISLSPGMYWFATNFDNGTVACISSSNGQVTLMDTMIGGSTGFKVLEATAGFLGLSLAQTFGTWPNVTGQSFTEVQTQGTVPLLAFQVLSSP